MCRRTARQAYTRRHNIYRYTIFSQLKTLILSHLYCTYMAELIPKSLIIQRQRILQNRRHDLRNLRWFRPILYHLNIANSFGELRAFIQLLLSLWRGPWIVYQYLLHIYYTQIHYMSRVRIDRYNNISFTQMVKAHF